MSKIELTADDLRAEIGNEISTFGTLVEVDEVQEMAIFESDGEMISRPFDTVEYKLNNEGEDKMAKPMFHCKTHDAPVYDYAHITEHKCTTPGRCNIREVDFSFETPDNSRFDLTGDSRSA